MEIKTCLECGNKFKPVRVAQKFCSKKCYQKVYQKNLQKNHPEKGKTSRRKYYNKNKEKLLLNHKKYYQKNKEKMLLYSKKRDEMKTRYFNDYKLSKGCQFCGYNKCAAALEFHHLYGKDFYIRASNFYTMSEKTKKELKKCILLCANCHRETHETVRNQLTALNSLSRNSNHYNKVKNKSIHSHNRPFSTFPL